MADFEDSLSPTWANVVGGQAALAGRRPPDADVRRHRTARSTALNDQVATLVVRPRGWHLVERHVEVDGAPISASAVRLRAVPASTTARELLRRGSGPYFYLPKMQSHREARLWNDVFVCGAGRARRPARLDPRDGADRDDLGRVRDGRDPVRAARARRGPQRRPLGLHLRIIKAFSPHRRGGPARPRAGDDGRAVHARLHAAAGAARAIAVARTRSAA